MDRQLQYTEEKLGKQAIGAIVTNIEVTIQQSPSTNSTASRRRTFDSDVYYRLILEVHMKKLAVHKAKRIKIYEKRMNFEIGAKKKKNCLILEHELNESPSRLYERQFQLSELLHTL